MMVIEEVLLTCCQCWQKASIQIKKNNEIRKPWKVSQLNNWRKETQIMTNSWLKCREKVEQNKWRKS